MGVIPILSLVTAPGAVDPIALPLSILIVFGSAKLLSACFEAMGQPGIVGQILAGILLGPLH